MPIKKHKAHKISDQHCLLAALGQPKKHKQSHKRWETFLCKYLFLLQSFRLSDYIVCIYTHTHTGDWCTGGCKSQCSPQLLRSLHLDPETSCLYFVHLTPCCDVPRCFRGFFTQPSSGVLSVLDPSLYWACFQGLFLHLYLIALFQSSFFQFSLMSTTSTSSVAVVRATHNFPLVLISNLKVPLYQLKDLSFQNIPLSVIWNFHIKLAPSASPLHQPMIVTIATLQHPAILCKYPFNFSHTSEPQYISKGAN